MAFTKGKNGNPHRREKGSQNKATAAVKEPIEQVLSDLDTMPTADLVRHGQSNGQTVVALTTPRTRLGFVSHDTFRKNVNTYSGETMKTKSPRPESWPRAFLVVNQAVT